MSYTSPEDALNQILDKARRLRRRVWNKLWQVPVAIVLGFSGATIDSTVRIDNTPNGPVWHPEDLTVPDATMAFTKNGNVVKALTRVTDQFVPGETSPEQIINDYFKKKIEFMLRQSKVFTRICDSVTEEPQQCLTYPVQGFGYDNIQISIPNSNVNYLDYPQGYQPLSENDNYKVAIVGKKMFLSLTDEIPPEWGGGEQPYINIHLWQGRVSLYAQDQNGNQGFVSDTGFVAMIMSGVDVPIRVTIPPLLDMEIGANQSVIVVQSQAFVIYATG